MIEINSEELLEIDDVDEVMEKIQKQNKEMTLETSYSKHPLSQTMKKHFKFNKVDL